MYSAVCSHIEKYASGGMPKQTFVECPNWFRALLAPRLCCRPRTDEGRRDRQDDIAAAHSTFPEEFGVGWTSAKDGVESPANESGAEALIDLVEDGPGDAVTKETAGNCPGGSAVHESDDRRFDGAAKKTERCFERATRRRHESVPRSGNMTSCFRLDMNSPFSRRA